MVPPRAVRRLVVDPVFFILAAVLVAGSPVVLLVTALVDLFLPGRLRTTRLLGVAVVFLACEVVSMLALFGLWIASGFGVAISSPLFERAHVRFLRWWLTRLNRAAVRLLGLRVELEDAQPPKPGAVLVFPRHAGPGDSILIAQLLMAGYDRQPRVVMKSTLQWAPTIDIVGNRLGGCFIRPGDRDASRFIARIGELAEGLGPQDAFVLFPEGGNFTERRRRRAIDKLRETGRERYAEQAERMKHLLAPRPGGALAAISASPDADVVFVAHTGLEPLSSMRSLWSSVPLEHPILGRYWRITPSDVPADRDERIGWLYSWWETIDGWIDSKGSADAQSETTS